MSSSIMNELKQSLADMGEKFAAAPWEDKWFYSQWLAQTTFFTRHTTRLLSLAGAHCPREYQALHNRFLEHAGEEKGHENLTLLDLKTVGAKIDDFYELPSTQSLYQTQYYWIEHKSPMAFFGFILALECLADKHGRMLTKRAEGAFGPKGVHFLRVHAEEDIDHSNEAIAQVEALPKEYHPMILENMRQCFANYDAILNECKAYSASMKKQKAA
jgi:pyrroloquinoline quinone (PQQ) biosynthesis protein C